jgi:ribonuclease Z
MSSFISILTSPTVDTPGACLYMHFDSRKYLIGRVGEGTQRIFPQRRLGVTALEQIFLTGEINWSTVGGLMGMLLTVADVIKSAKESLEETNKTRIARGQPPIRKNALDKLEMHGAENLTYAMATTRSFIFRTGMPFKTYELAADRRMANPEDVEPDYKDDCVNVWKVPLRKLAKKRKFDETNEEMDLDSPVGKKLRPEEQKELYELVESMFNSSWRLDTLIPTKLHDVKLPAKIFVRGEDRVLRKYDGPLPGEAPSVPNIEVLVREPWPATKVSKLPSTSFSSESMCYIFKNHARRGKFDARLAKELGIEPRDNKRLIAGESLPGKDGKMVTREMVVGADMKGLGFAVVDIPNQTYLDSFLGRPEWTNKMLMDGVGAIYWILGDGLIANPDIQKFMRDHTDLKHISLSPDSCPNMVANVDFSQLYTKLGRVDPARFPPIDFQNTIPELDIQNRPYETGRAGKKVKTTPPQLQFEDNDIVPFFSAATVENIPSEILARAETARQVATDPEFLARIDSEERDIPNRDAEIISLGTGSAIPSKYRNVSSTLIRVPGVGNYLLDCGENALGQIRRAFGREEAARIIKDLKFVFISHMHADHHLGTVSVLDAWQKESMGTNATLAISCTSFMQRFLEEFAQVQPLDMSRLRFYGDTHDDVNYDHVFPANDPSGLAELARIRVDHCKSAHAGLLVLSSGLRIAFSGDCRPSKNFARRAKGAHLLVHEATLEDDKVADAIAKKHSTISEALGVAEDMAARRVLLTHFSQRYAKGSDEATKDKEGDHRVVLAAFDLMRVKLGEFRVAEAYLPVMKDLLELENN